MPRVSLTIAILFWILVMFIEYVDWEEEEEEEEEEEAAWCSDPK